MADDHTETDSRRHGEAGFEGLGAGADCRRPLGYHLMVMRITVGGLTVQPTC